MTASLFADTTVLFEYHVGTSEVRDEVRNLFADEDVVTSEHALREWIKILFHNAEAVREASESQQDLAAMFKKLAAGFGRQQAQRLLALAMVTRGSSMTDLDEINMRARQMLRVDAVRIFERTASEIRTNSSCGLAEQRPQLTSAGKWEMKTTCRKGEGICDHERRIESDVARWKDGATALEQTDDDSLRKMGKAATGMALEPSARTGKNCYARTGDVAIALDCQGETLVTTDKSFEVLGEAMGFPVRRIKPSTEGAG